MIHYFWTLCPSDIKDGDTFTVNIEQVTCADCLAQVVPFTDQTSATSEDDTAAYHGQERAV